MAELGQIVALDIKAIKPLCRIYIKLLTLKPEIRYQQLQLAAVRIQTMLWKGLSVGVSYLIGVIKLCTLSQIDQ